MLVFRPTRRSRKPAFIATVSIAITLFLIVRWYALPPRDHYLDPSAFHHDHDLVVGGNNLLTPKDATTVCRTHGFSAYTKHRKVYDLVLFSTELDWLEIRLQTLAPYVDYFVVIESPTTFTTRPKPLILRDNWDRFKQFHNKMIYKMVEDPIKSARIWDHEDFFRDALLKEVFPGLVGTPQAAQKNDVLVVCDMDEILRPSAMLVMRYCDIPKRLILQTHFYYYSFQWLHRGEQWAHPDATLYAGSIESTLSPNDLRQGLLGPGWAPFAVLSRWWNRASLWNAGWHCSSCFANVSEMRTKMHSFSHQGWNTADNRDRSVMIERVRHGLDLFGREAEVYDRVENNQDVPEYVLEQYRESGRFGYLLNRDGAGAGFEDWDVVSAHD